MALTQEISSLKTKLNSSNDSNWTLSSDLKTLVHARSKISIDSDGLLILDENTSYPLTAEEKEDLKTFFTTQKNKLIKQKLTSRLNSLI